MAEEDFDDAVARCTFNLTYRREEGRTFTYTGITGDDIDDAYGDGTAPGEWCHTFPNLEDDNVDWVRYFFRAALNEAVHEALEWFRVDGNCLLDPHRLTVDEKIFALCDDFADTLYALAATKDTTDGR